MANSHYQVCSKNSSDESSTEPSSAWRPLKHVVQNAPLAFCDFASVDAADLIATDRPSREYIGEVYYMKYNCDQKWYWLSQQMPDELSLFMSYDSDPGEGGAACKTPRNHSRRICIDCSDHLQSLPAFRLFASRERASG